MATELCPHGKDPRMCAYCDKKDTCGCRCDKNTDVIWGEITGNLADQTDLQAALDKHTADILAADTLAHNNEQRLDAVENTAEEANQRSKDNTSRLDSVEGTANATKALTDIHETRLGKVEGIANEANTRSQDNTKRLDKVEGVANGAKALADTHTELLNKANTTIADLIEQDKSHSESIEELTERCEALQGDIDRVDTKANTAQATADTKADKVHSHAISDVTGLQSALNNKANSRHTHSSIGNSNGTSVEADGSNVYIRDNQGNIVFKTRNGNGTNSLSGVQITSGGIDSQLLIDNIVSVLRSPNGNNTYFRVEDNKISIKYESPTDGLDQELKMDDTGFRVKQPGSDKVAFQANPNETSVKFDGSMGLRLKADQSELKFSGKGLTVTKTETKVTSAGKVELLAPSIEARDSKDNPIFSTERKFKSGTTTDEQQTIIFVGDKEYRTGDGTSAEIVLNGDMELYTTLQSLQSGKRSRFEMPMTIDWIKQDGQLLSKEMCKYLYSAIYRYIKISINSEDFVKEDEASLMLRQLSGENIYPVILSKYWFDGYAQAAHAQHFKPWLVEFYDEIQSYDSEEGIVSVSFIRIHIGEDFSRWLIKGLRYNELDAEMTITHMQCVIGEATEESVANITPEAVNFIVYATRGEEKDLEVGHFNLRTQL